jgi:small subunit ribosomal protein S29
MNLYSQRNMVPAIDLVNSSTPYVYDPRTRTYVQPEFSYQLLQRFQKVNAEAIVNLKIGKEFAVGKRILPVGTLLTDVISLALKDHSFAPAALKTVFEEIARQNEYV